MQQQAVSAPDTTVHAPVHHGIVPQKLQDAAMKTSGYGYLIGDAALVGAGLAEGIVGGRFQPGKINKDAVGNGIAFVGGGLSCAHYGKPTEDLQAKMAARHLGHYLRERGIDVSTAEDLRELRDSKTFIGSLDSYMYDHPDEALGFGGVVGGALAIKDGMKKELRRGGTVGSNGLRVASGVLVAAGGLAGLLMSEHPDEQQGPNEHHGREGWLAREYDHVKNHPMLLSSAAYVASNLAGVAAVTRDAPSTHGRAPHLLRVLNTSSYLLSNIILGAASKDQSKTYGLDAAHLDHIVLLAGKTLLAQPEPLRNGILEDMAQFMSRQPEIKQTPEQISALIRAKLDDIEKGRFTEQTIAAAHAPALQAATAAAVKTGWSNRVAAASPTPVIGRH